MERIDLRSDTVTLPTPAMLEAITRAELGDDVLGEDPTVKRLEALAAERLGKPAAMLTISGTMSNLVALLTHCSVRGDEFIIGHEGHILHHEMGGSAVVGGIHAKVVRHDWRGMLDPAEVAEAIRPTSGNVPRTALICLENTVNRTGGTVLTPADVAAIAAVARHHSIPIHLDGARLFNAAVALGVAARELVRDVDSVCFCLSKGLSAPLGSLLCGSEDFIARARRYRKLVGGAMRQAGIIAAAGIVALDTMVERLAEDHANARLLAEGLQAQPGVTLLTAEIQTNLVFFSVEGWDARKLTEELQRRGVLMLPQHRWLRAVTHSGIERRHVERTLAIVKEVLRASPARVTA